MTVVSASREHPVTGAEVRGYNLTQMTDAALVNAVLQGNTGAFTQLVDRHSRACLRFATRMLGNIEDAEDVTQETFVRAYGALGRYDGTAAFQTWLMSILINRCRTALQTRKRRDAQFVFDEATVASAASPERTADAALREIIERALTRLDHAQREAFLLKHVEQLSYDEMSAMTGVGVSALKMRVQRACDRLQVLLKEDHDA